MTGAAIDTLYKLAWAYPFGVESGDIPSKAGRGDLIRDGFATYENGVTYLSKSGFELYQLRRDQRPTRCSCGATEADPYCYCDC